MVMKVVVKVVVKVVIKVVIKVVTIIKIDIIIAIRAGSNNDYDKERWMKMK